MTCCTGAYTGIKQTGSFRRCANAATAAGSVTITGTLNKLTLTNTCKDLVIEAKPLLAFINTAAKAKPCGTTKCAKAGTVVQKCCQLKHATIAHDSFMMCADPAKDKTSAALTTGGILNVAKGLTFAYTCDAVSLVATAALSAAAVAYSI